MKRVLTYVIAAVFAWCLFIVLPDRAMNRASAFSDGNQTPIAAVRETAPSIKRFNGTEKDSAARRLLAIDYRLPVDAVNFDSAILNFNNRVASSSEIPAGDDNQKLETEQTIVRQTFDLPPNLRRPEDEPDRNPRLIGALLPRFVLEL